MVMRCVPSEICTDQEKKFEHQSDGSVLNDEFNAWFAIRMKKQPIVREIMMLKCPAVVIMYKNGTFKVLPMEAIS
jgi:hypothetical protein